MKTSPLKTKKRLAGSIYMVMFSVSHSKNLFLQLLLDLELSFLPCKKCLVCSKDMIQDLKIF
jgi:hypothetical protein